MKSRIENNMPEEQKEWWEESCPFQDDFKEAFIAPLIAEAERRGQVKAWEETKNVLIDLLGIGMDESVRFKMEYVEDKLTELKSL